MEKSKLNIRDKRTIEGIVEEFQYALKHSIISRPSFYVPKIQLMIKRLEEIGK